MKRVFISLKFTHRLHISFLLCCLLLLSCDHKEPIRLGFIASISGPAADFGISARDAVQLAVTQCNGQGGIRGRQIKLIIKDDRQNAETAEQAVKELIKEGVVAIVGPMSSKIAMAIVPYLNDSKMMAMGGAVSTQRLSGLDDYFFRVCITSREHAFRSAHYQIDSGDMRRIAVVYDGGNPLFCEGWLEDFKRPFIAGGGEILTVVDFKTEEKRPFSEIVNGLLTAGPDGILVIANSMDSALFCQQIRKSNPSVKITLSNWSATQRLIELGGKAVEGATLPSVFDWESPNPSYQTFRNLYVERYKQEPGFPGFYAYNAARVVLTALKSQKRGQNVKSTVLSIGEFEGLQGKIVFDEYGDVKRSNASIRIIRDQKFVAVE